MVQMGVTPQQAKLLLDAIRERDTAAEKAALVLNVLTAGFVGPNVSLSGVDVETGVLTFT